MSPPRQAAPKGSGLPAARLLASPRLPESSLFVLAGPDDYLRERVLERLRGEVLDPGFAEFNHTRLLCTSATKAAALVDALVELPMLAERRLLEIHEAQALKAEVGRALVPSLEEAARAGTTVVALGWKPEGRGGSKSPLLDAAKRVGLEVDCSLAEEERPSWLQATLRRLGLEVEPAGVAEILKRAGSDLRHLESQLEKLALYAGPSRRAGLADVRQVVLRSAEVKTWTLTAAIGKRNLREAMGILTVLLDEGEAPGGLLSYVNSYLRGVAQVFALRARVGPSASAIAREIPGKAEYQVRKTLEELGTWTEAELRRAFDMMCRADLRIKTGADPRLVLELLLVQLCSRRGTRR